MMTSMKRMAVMSVALVLFCVTVVAQSVKSTENTRSNSSGVTVSPNYILLSPGGEEEATITLEVGYAHPFLIYDGDNNFQTNNDRIVENSFTATLNGNTITITANPINYIDSDVFYVSALVAETNESYNGTKQIWGFPVTIVIDPSLKTKQSNQTSSVNK